MDLTRKTEFESFNKKKVDISSFDKDYIESWNERSFFSQMLDVWGEMNYTNQSYDEYKNNPSQLNKDTLIAKANNMHKVCDLVVNNPNVYLEEKKSLRFAEWQFYEYIFGYSKDNSSIKWFNQWCYDINYDLV